MKTCKDCLHYEACRDSYDSFANEYENYGFEFDEFDEEDYGRAGCLDFTARSEWVHLPNIKEIIHCAECLYFSDENSKNHQGVCLCGEKDMNYGAELYPFANDFCSYGTPKERGGEK